ncbi:MAG: peptidoglycan-binding protein [Rhodobacteraceae bacterium]|nr:peptidoglycan-binding protein [Paracoccaceae bacterium]
MQVRFKHLAAALTLSMATMAGGVSAADLALIISNGDYENLSDQRKISRNHDDLVEAFKDEGFEVIEGVNLTRQEMLALSKRADSISEAVSNFVILLSGNIVNDGQQTWVLPVDTAGDTLLDAAFGAPTLDTFLSMAGAKPGHASVFIGVSDVDPNRKSGLKSGLADTAIPQGVLLVSGQAGDIEELLTDDLLGSNRPMSVLLANPSHMDVAGYVSPDNGLTGPSTTTEAPAPGNWVDFVAEQTLWAVADKSNDPDDLEEYLRRFPNGIFAPAARARLDAAAPVAVASRPEEIEAALRLSRDERRIIQTNLTMLGYDTRGVDGILGRGSRSAIAAWQDSQRFDATGYLTDIQIARLRAQGDAERAVQEVADLRFWNATGVSGRKSDLELYLERYPVGVHADEARELLAVYEAEEETQRDSAAWSAAVAGGTANSYRAYLAEFPDGIYASVAKQRVEALDPAGSTDVNAAKAAEDRLNLNVATRLLIENRLKSAGFNPGRLDGVFDSSTRKAIEKYQKDHGLNKTGYIDAATVRALLLG